MTGGLGTELLNVTGAYLGQRVSLLQDRAKWKEVWLRDSGQQSVSQPDVLKVPTVIHLQDKVM